MASNRLNTWILLPLVTWHMHCLQLTIIFLCKPFCCHDLMFMPAYNLAVLILSSTKIWYCANPGRPNPVDVHNGIAPNDLVVNKMGPTSLSKMAAIKALISKYSIHCSYQTQTAKTLFAFHGHDLSIWPIHRVIHTPIKQQPINNMLCHK